MRAVAALHIFIIALTNLLVQFPLNVLGLHSTWGALSYPLIFIITDLTIRMKGAAAARRIILLAMLPGLFISYSFASVVQTMTTGAFIFWNLLAFRVALASFSAY